MQKPLLKMCIFALVFALGCDGSKKLQNRKLEIGGSSGITMGMNACFQGFRKTNAIPCSYQTTGSYAGIKLLVTKDIDIAIADTTIAHLLKSDNTKPALGTTQIPIAINSTIVVYNLSGINQSLHFTGPLLADIFLGKVTKWNDRAIKDLNRDVALPDLAISVVYRNHSSSTTRTFSKYLSNHSQAFRDSVGHGMVVKWPIGRAVIPAEGLRSMLRETEGSISYIEYPIVLPENFGVGVIQNNDSVFVAPGIQSMTAASEALKSIESDDFYLSIIDAPGKSSYPICSLYAAVIPKYRLKQDGDPAVAFLKWVLDPGQGVLAELGYAPLSPELLKLSLKSLE